MLHNLILLETINITFSTSSDNWLKNIVPIIAAIITSIATIWAAKKAVDGVEKTINSNQKLKNQESLIAEKLKNKELLNDLDQKSEWRKELMNIAAKPVIQLKDVYRILASLRFLPKSKDEIEVQANKEVKKVQKDESNQKNESKQKEFDIISNYIYNQLNKILNEKFKDSLVSDLIDERNLKNNLTFKESEEIRQYTKFLLKHHWEYNKGEEDREKFKTIEINEFKKVINEIENLCDRTHIINYPTNAYIGELKDHYH
ncbi:hypothetical protein [Staphylococcus hominis]|uniref:hypothetical protein n=1 Tax=Staphylococcus hominis TaxID=1290 RepID=UPI00119DC920|nr:hypothetical protein [Staphylococcus hominis]